MNKKIIVCAIKWIIVKLKENVNEFHICTHIRIKNFKETIIYNNNTQGVTHTHTIGTTKKY